MTLTLGLLALLLAPVVGIVCVDPRAKDWAAEIIERAARWAVRELRARAMAQRAARTIWTATYRQALRQEARSAGNWTPAAPSAAHDNPIAAVIPPCAAAVQEGR